MYKFVSLTLVVLTIGTLPCQSRSQSDDVKSVEDQKAEPAKLREIFASVDQMPDKGARWVEVQIGPVEQKSWHKGWLLRESKDEIQLLTVDGSKQTFDKNKLAGKKPAADIKWSAVWAVRDGDFVKFCREFLGEKKEIKDDPNEDGDGFLRERAAADAAVVDSARLACWANVTGNEELARQLLKSSVDTLQERRSTYTRLPENEKLHQFVAGAAFPHPTLSPLLRDRDGDPRNTRIRSLERNRTLAKIPYRSDHDAVLQKIKQLESLIAEDKAWKEPAKEELAKQDVKQKATYWLYHLRDLNLTQSSQPGMCRVLTDTPWPFKQAQHPAKEDATNAAVELRKLGYEILPQLIAHLEDNRPTRCVGFWRGYAPDSYYTLTYGDCCQQIFEAIALHSIYEKVSLTRYPVRDGLGKQCKERAEQWWQEFQKKGEKRVLIEATQRGNRDSYLNAERLITKFPEAAFEPLRDGIGAAKEDWIRSSLLKQMRQLKDDRALEFLRAEANGTGFFPRE